MKWRTFEIQREPGFRLNLIDVLLIAVILVITWAGACFFSDHHLYLLPLYVGASFFLFCNVFRIGNRLEACWYVPFLFVAGFALLEPSRFWWIVLGICEPLRVVLVAYGARTGSYRGILGKGR